MKNEEDESSPSSSPPTPPSPLPVSVGPGNQRYLFSPSPSPSPPFTPPSSSHTAAEGLPLLLDKLNDFPPVAAASSTFSLDQPPQPGDSSSQSSCLKDLLKWLVERCCDCCSWTLAPLSKPHEG
ncbi:hypothetical protein Nepgr_023844 [Nepenthes gracilis]|uniref:Uncharacterized protein n=1 Tax=Nepenthes gracilis TaxID=150966 RepID=A0AAD3T3K3_NEPGR|nr:hypothetical protein Nepgr_023844 [Nepenthes gracilis]